MTGPKDGLGEELDPQGQSRSAAASGEELGYSGDIPVRPDAPALGVGDLYDPRPHEDSARRAIAYLLIGLLWLLISGMLILVAFGTVSVADMKEFAVVLGPVVALVSAATGFYYGTKSS